MAWSLDLVTGLSIFDVPTVDGGTAADVERLNPRVDYTIVSTATLTVQASHDGARLRCRTEYLGPNIPERFRFDPEFWRTFASDAISVRRKYL